MKVSRSSWGLREANALSSPALLVALTAMVFVAASLRDMSDVWQRAQSVQADVDCARVQLAAETVLLRHADMAVGVHRDEVADVCVEVRRDSETFVVTCCDGSSEQPCATFVAQALQGGAPSAFVHGRVACTQQALRDIGGGQLVRRDELPALDQAAVRVAPRATELRGLRRDSSIALQVLAVGTDREDYVWGDGDPDGGATPAGGLMVLPGNLWIAPADEVFELHLTQDLVLVVQGNLYVCNSMRVQGGGRLLLITAGVPDAVAFADRDASGGWSDGDELRGALRFRGPVEGAGSAYFDCLGTGNPVALDAGLVVTGELHVGLQAQVCGPLVLHHGVTWTRPQGGLVGAGRWSYRPGRERIPAFPVAGSPRPGLLRRVEN